LLSVSKKVVDLNIHKTENYIIKDGVKFYKDLGVPKGMRIKYQKEDERKHYPSYEAYKISQLMIVTKWIISNSTNNYIDESINLNYIILCNYLLKFYTDNTYYELYNHYGIPTGGEILHRISNMQFRSNSYNFCMSKYVNQFVCSIGKEFTQLYSDGNINFSLIKNIIRGKLGYCEYLGVNNDHIRKSTEIITGPDFIENVHINYIYVPDNSILTTLTEYGKSIAAHKDISSITELLSRQEPEDLIGYLDYKGNESIEELINNSIFNFYNDMLYNNSYKGFDLSPEICWEKFKIGFDKEFTTYRNMNNEEFIQFAQNSVKQKLITNRMETLNYSNEELLELTFTSCDHLLGENRIREFTRKLTELLNNLPLISNSSSLDQDPYEKLIIEFNLTKEKVALQLILQFMSLYCLDFKLNNKQTIYLDVEQTIENFNKRFHRMSFNIILDRNLITAITIIGADYIKQVFKNQRSKLYHFLRFLKNNMILQYTRQEATREIIITNEFDMDRELPNFNNIKYHQEIIDLKLIKNGKILSHIMSAYKEMSYLISHPNSFFSLTASDSFCALYMLANNIKDEYPNNFKICDLTAGRGDGYVALKKNLSGYIIHSYSIKTVFTKLGYYPKAIIYKDYDVFNFESIYFSLDYDIIIIDISFVKISDESRHKLTDTIYNLVIRHNKIIYLRINL